MKATRDVCPKCKQRAGVAIVYGMPTREGLDAVMQGEIALGGCFEPIGAPNRRCRACGHKWTLRREGHDAEPSEK